MFELTKDEANNLYSNGEFQIGTPLYNFSTYAPIEYLRHRIEELKHQGVKAFTMIERITTAITLAV